MSKPKYDAKRVTPETLQRYLETHVNPGAVTVIALDALLDEATVPELRTATEVVDKVLERSNGRVSGEVLNRWSRHRLLVEFLEELNAE